MTIANGQLADASDVLKSLSSAGYLADKVFLNDTANAKLTQGITLNQGANDDEIFSLKSSDVTHANTDATEADTYAAFKKLSATAGGLNVLGWASGGIGLDLTGTAGGGADTTKSAAAGAPVRVIAWETDGAAGAQAPGANENLFVVVAGSNTRFIVDTEGDLHADGSATTVYDAYDDLALLVDINRVLADPIRAGFNEWLNANRSRLQELKLVTFNEDGHHFVNYSALARLHTGAFVQLGARLERIERVIRRIPILGRLLLE